MIQLIMVPLSYLLGIIISKFTKEELMIRKKWLKNWPYLTALIPLTLAFDSTLCLITISIINYFKASHDFIFKTKCKRRILENLLFLAAAFAVILL